MARSITDIHAEILTEKDNYPELAALSSTSKVAIWYLWTLVIATCMWTIEKLFDAHVEYVNGRLALLKPHTLRWYVAKAKAFQYGYSLVQDQDYYDNSLLTDAEITASQVIKYAAAVGTTRGIKIKIATITGGDLAQVPEPQITVFKAYMHLVKDAGVRLFYVNEAADSLKLHLKIYYNALVLDADGQRIDGTNNTPVQDTIDTFLKEGTIFNSLFIPTRLVDALQAVDGVIIPHIHSIEAKYAALPFSAIVVEYLPNSGYLRINDPSHLTLEFIAHEII